MMGMTVHCGKCGSVYTSMKDYIRHMKHCQKVVAK